MVLVVFHFSSPVEANEDAVPTEEGVGLSNVHGMLPEIGKVRDWFRLADSQPPLPRLVETFLSSFTGN